MVQDETEETFMKCKQIIPIIVLLCLTVIWGCPKKADVTSAPEEQKQETAAAPNAAALSETQKEDEARKAADAKKAADEAAAAESAKRAEEDQAREKAAKNAAGPQPVYFDFDKAFIRDDAKAVMKANAEWLKANPKAKIRIEGNCDERGTKEYNQALGQRRAVSAKKYLTDLGISAKRITLVSYGKEKPVCTENDESCWQKNRRDEFVVIGE